MIFGKELIPKVLDRSPDECLCGCGCGALTSLSSVTNKSRGLVKGEPMRFLPGHSGKGRFWITDLTSCRRHKDFVEIPVHDRGVVAAWTLVDSIDAGRACSRRWRLSNGYVVAGNDNSRALLHRLVLRPPSDLVVDHRDGNPLNNRRANLRAVTQAENQQNRVGGNRGSSSAHRGVFWDRSRLKWVARAQVAGKQYHGGVFDSEQDAAAAAVRLRRELMPANEGD